ncbi:MAG: polyamine aminopropyltransferase [Proteobacteria bacterium]|nr:MAG: polyamine aminopropyltransferase [Pseudomonadota bacterium]
MAALLLASVFVIATAGLVYELIAGTLASYLLGDSITQFSTIIGVYLSSMGIGSYLSKFIKKDLLRFFIRVELLLAVFGGSSAAMLFIAFSEVSEFRILLYGSVVITGTLVGIEIPILMRILKDEYDFKELVAKVFTFDYLGALLASLLFPLVLVPQLGLVRSAFLFGLANALVAWATLEILGKDQPWMPRERPKVWFVTFLMALGLGGGDYVTRWGESLSFPDPVIAAVSSPYQRVLLTKRGNDLRMFLNGNLQFSSTDEYRYHEALVHPGLSALKDAKNILVLGGGDGLAVREIWKYPNVEKVTMIDLDSAVTDLATKNSLLLALNQNSLDSKKFHLVHQDAFRWLKSNKDVFDFIIIDFPDPSNFSIGKLYSTRFYDLVKSALADKGLLVVQSTSPFYAKKSYWTIVNTLTASGFKTAPYHAYVPSFGEWGFVIAGREDYKIPDSLPDNLRFLTTGMLPDLFEFPSDMQASSTQINRLDNQALVRTFEDEWAQYVR